ncbi:sugar phosphate isomerase/epimerase family protein [Draconibacterium sp.]|uniref:sugar phosphate isomerase/epimerase family protein n=1 Tax=Draconibacterium sp. TaxID=1965318 RepID=UPI0035658B2B
MNSRRSFIKRSLLASMVPLTGLTPVFGMSILGGNSKRKVYIFSKHLQWLDFDEMALTAKNIGFDGIDLTVRPKGHVIPERVKEDLPRAINAIKAAGLDADRMTTAITDPEDALTIDILETAAKEGIKNYRLGWFDYNPTLSIEENITGFNLKLRGLAKLNKELGLTAAYQNHAGEMAGGPVWDMSLMLDGIDPNLVGVRYDIRHATVEGGTSWPLGMKLLADKINSFDVKDFIWKKTDGKWRPFNVRVGEGMVDFDRYFQIIDELSIKGDFTIHLEYPIGGAEHGATTLSCSSDEVISAMKKNLNTLRSFL